ncbi:MAG: o-succinylbenzoate synthase, partial [Muribaculaceae bacterium]|nr:o-succinylbenzoate synthase [Muribaculaceae bacterium]
MIRAAYAPYKLRFIAPAVTSRSVMLHKDAFFLKVWDDDCPDRFGVGECALFRGLGADDRPGYEERVALLCREVNAGVPVSDLSAWGSVLFGWETAVSDLANGGRRIPFPSAFSAGEEEIPINGLVWMGTGQEMAGRIRHKLDAGFRCVKLKIGGIGFDSELELLRYIRKRFSAESLELRLDANGAFSPAEALTRIDALSRFGIHSIEQPIRQGQYADMARICRESPVDIALDEELIGLTSTADKERM